MPFIAIPLIKFEIEKDAADNKETPPDEKKTDAPHDEPENQPEKRSFRDGNLQSIVPYYTAPVVKFCYHTVSNYHCHYLPYQPVVYYY